MQPLPRFELLVEVQGCSDLRLEQKPIELLAPDLGPR